MFHKFSLIWCWFVWALTFFLPDFPFSMRFRGWLYSFVFKSCGSNFQVAGSCKILSAETIDVGDDVYFASNVVINGGGSIRIGHGVMLGFGAVVVSGNHTIENGSYRWGRRELGIITIGAGSWVGATAIVLAGSTIPPGSVIAAGGVVNTVLRDSGVYGGVPVRRLK